MVKSSATKGTCSVAGYSFSWHGEGVVTCDDALVLPGVLFCALFLGKKRGPSFVAHGIALDLSRFESILLSLPSTFGGVVISWLSRKMLRLTCSRTVVEYSARGYVGSIDSCLGKIGCVRGNM